MYSHSSIRPSVVADSWGGRKDGGWYLLGDMARSWYSYRNRMSPSFPCSLSGVWCFGSSSKQPDPSGTSTRACVRLGKKTNKLTTRPFHSPLQPLAGQRLEGGLWRLEIHHCNLKSSFRTSNWTGMEPGILLRNSYKKWFTKTFCI